MNLYEFTTYVNLDIDDIYEVDDIARWFNKGITSYNIIPPLTKYPIVGLDDESLSEEYTLLDDTFILGIMLPFVNGAIMGQESAVEEKGSYYSEFVRNAREYKLHNPIPNEYMVDGFNADLDNYRIGQNAFVSDMAFSPMAGTWGNPSNYVTFKDEEPVVETPEPEEELQPFQPTETTATPTISAGYDTPDTASGISFNITNNDERIVRIDWQIVETDTDALVKEGSSFVDEDAVLVASAPITILDESYTIKNVRAQAASKFISEYAEEKSYTRTS